MDRLAEIFLDDELAKKSDLWLDTCAYADLKADATVGGVMVADQDKDKKFKGRKAELVEWKKGYDERKEACEYIGKWKKKQADKRLLREAKKPKGEREMQANDHEQDVHSKEHSKGYPATVSNTRARYI